MFNFLKRHDEKVITAYEARECERRTLDFRFSEVSDRLRGLERRLEALERANWHKGIENNCTECREVCSK